MLILKDRYPGQTDDTDPSGYPHGKARNASSIGSGDGTPLEQDLINDIQGAMQALAVAADVTPSGDPERADASDVLDALRRMFGVDVQVFLTSGTWAKPDWATPETPVRVILQGDGGGGGTLPPETISFTGGGGGGQGGYDEATLFAGVLSSAEPVTVGQGGSGDGDGSSFGSGDYQLTVPGGKAGVRASNDGTGGDGFSGGGAGAPGGTGANGADGGSRGGNGGSVSGHPGGSGARNNYPFAAFGKPGTGGEGASGNGPSPGTGGTGFGAGGGGQGGTGVGAGGGGGGAAGWAGLADYPGADHGGHEAGNPGVVVVITGPRPL